MSLNDRLDFEEGKLESVDLFTKYCANCKYYPNLFFGSQNYCHKCINNPKINLNKSKLGIVLDELFDYYSPYIFQNPIEKFQGQKL